MARIVVIGAPLAGSAPRSGSPTAATTCSWSSAIHPRPRRTATTCSRNRTDRTSPVPPGPRRLRPFPQPVGEVRAAVLDRLRDDGIEEINFFKMLAPAELHRPEDDEFTGLLSRRPAFELALRLSAAE